jgi:hypothetical protein
MPTKTSVSSNSRSKKANVATAGLGFPVSVPEVAACPPTPDPDMADHTESRAAIVNMFEGGLYVSS